MAKTDAVVAGETRYIAVWVVILSTVMEAVFLIIGKWSYKVLLGNILGGAAAVLNFYLMGITVQSAVMKEEKESAMAMKASQSLRSLMLLIVALLGIVLPVFNAVAVIAPLFFPRIAIAFVPLRDRKKNIGEVKKDGE